MNPLPALISFCLFISTSLFAVEPETAWDKDSGRMTENSTYVFGSMALPPDFLPKMVQEADDEIDPFSTKSKDDPQPRFRTRLSQIAPQVPMQQLPACLNRHPAYHDLAPLLRQHGVAIKDPEWALFSAGLSGDFRLYFCTTWAKADIIEQIFTPLIGHGPRSLVMQATLVSVEPQKRGNQRWTYQRLSQLSPTIHARYGNISRSGERSSMKLLGSQGQGGIEYEITLGSNAVEYDCRLYISYDQPESDKMQGVQSTAFTGHIGVPFIINCGSRGEAQRNYFLIIHSRLRQMTPRSGYAMQIHQRLNQIEGIFAMLHNKTAPKATPREPAPVTRSYQVQHNFLEKLRDSMNHIDPSNRTGPPARVSPSPKTTTKTTAKTTAVEASAQIYDITPQLKKLGFTFQPEEWVYYNASRQHLIFHCAEFVHNLYLSNLKKICAIPRMLRIKIQLINIEHHGSGQREWNLKSIEAHKPILLRSYGSVTRSGEKATFGDALHHTPEQPEQGKEPLILYSCEVEPTLCADNQHFDIRLSLETPALGKDKLQLDLNTALTAKDGEPTIIELGHPTNGHRSLLLVLHTDLITPNGSFYRDMFAPIQEPIQRPRFDK